MWIFQEVLWRYKRWQRWISFVKACFDTKLWYEKNCAMKNLFVKGEIYNLFTRSSSRVNERFIIKLCNDINFIPQIFSPHYFLWIILAQNYSCNVNSLHNPLGNLKRMSFIKLICAENDHAKSWKWNEMWFCEVENNRCEEFV